MSFDEAAYRAASTYYHLDWSPTDTALYWLCRQHPDHQSRGSINAKLWIIGRAYATGIERKIASKRTQGSSMEQLAEHLWQHRNAADNLLRELRSLKQPLNPETIARIISIHARFVGIVQGVLRKGQTPRSFVSKYLHFHNPVVPIYDSVAVIAARKFYPHSPGLSTLPAPSVADLEYARFLQRFWRLYQEAQSSGLPVTVKLLDHYLLALAKKIQLSR